MPLGPVETPLVGERERDKGVRARVEGQLDVSATGPWREVDALDEAGDVKEGEASEVLIGWVPGDDCFQPCEALLDSQGDPVGRGVGNLGEG